RQYASGMHQCQPQQYVRYPLSEHPLELALSLFGPQSMGDLLAIADNDARQATGVLAPFPYASGVSLLIVGTIVLLFLIDPWLGLTGLIGLTIVTFIEVKAAVTVYPAWEGIQAQVGEVSGVAHESFDGAVTVKALGREEYEIERLSAASEDLANQIAAVNEQWEPYRLLSTSMLPAFSLPLLVVGAFRVDVGAVTPGDVVSGLYLLGLLAFPVQLIAFVLFDMAASIP